MAISKQLSNAIGGATYCPVQGNVVTSPTGQVIAVQVHDPWHNLIIVRSGPLLAQKGWQQVKKLLRVL